ncbi:hypothetical protein SAMN05216570_3982 [Dyella sp. OK004]|uniref:class I SAM-dependent methyltransferase n=1 Tax=Dyella sp. OK004 TaxID=1855292 RepID=UPI0008ED7D7D|nr:class I SAM-dependent methyltransferase [Dyella sp. OK004]SFS19315.1 hypothetical protein SAMN05216570_3982 [Dyella sp. OK004]
MDRRGKLLQGIDIAHVVSVEIGALCHPMIKREDGQVIYVDHDDQAALRKHYVNDPNVDVDAIVQVDAVWGDQSLSQIIPQRVQCVVACHVIEHVPNLIGWLREVRSILDQMGELRLIIPDRRFTFDFLRADSRIEDVAYAHLMNARVPLAHRVLEYVVNVAKVDCYKAWSTNLLEADLERHHTLQHAMVCAKQSSEGAYHDIHCWVFTPKSFALLMADLCEHGLMEFECSMFHDTEPFTGEFFSGLRYCDDQERAIHSWRGAAAKCKPFEPVTITMEGLRQAS